MNTAKALPKIIKPLKLVELLHNVKKPPAQSWKMAERLIENLICEIEIEKDTVSYCEYQGYGRLISFVGRVKTDGGVGFYNELIFWTDSLLGCRAVVKFDRGYYYATPNVVYGEHMATITFTRLAPQDSEIYEWQDRLQSLVNEAYIAGYDLRVNRKQKPNNLWTTPTEPDTGYWLVAVAQKSKRHQR